MKTRSFFFFAVAALAVVSCSPKVSDKTAVTGNLGASITGQAEISIKEIGYSDYFTITAGKFTAEIPACQTGIARIKAGNLIGSFVSDGTPLTITVNDDKSFNVVSKYPKISTQAKYEAFQKGMTDLQKAYQPKIESTSDEDAKDKLYDAYEADAKKLCLDAVNNNKDNIIAVSAIESLQYLLDNNSMDSLLSTVGPAVSEVGSIKKIKEFVTARKATAEGSKFTDFEVDGKKLSDYVGKGKWVLVDFWASWCGPCKAEMPNLQNVYSKYAGKDFDMLSVAVWDKPESTVKTAKSLGIVWNQIINAQSIPTDLYGIQGIPHIILFGPDGTIVKRDLRGDDIEAEVAKHVQPVK